MRMTTVAVLCTAILTGIAMAAAPIIPDTPVDDAWVTCDGSVNAIARHGDTVYLGGSFRHIAPHSGAGVAINAGTGATSGVCPKVKGNVNAAVADTAGGWFIGGTFTEAGGRARNHLAHITAGGTVSDWNPNADGAIESLALSADGATLFVGGTFTNIGGQARNNAAALNAASGVATDWNPDADGAVYTLALSPDGGIVYAGGDFENIGGHVRNRLAALTAAGQGVALGWNPNADNTVRALALSQDGGSVYIGGEFRNIGVEARNRIAALEAATGEGTIYPWAPNANAAVYAIALSADGTIVYAAGGFTTIGGQARNRIAALRVDNGNATDWNPNASMTVSALAVPTNGALVYAGGVFTTIGGQTRNRIAALRTDLNVNNATDWDPNANGWVKTMAMARDGNTVYAGGAFSAMGGGVERNRIAALNAFTGALTDWNPNANGTVDALTISPDGTLVYAGGAFTDIGGQTRNRIAALRADNGNATDWNPNADNHVNALTIAANGATVYAGGQFLNIGGQARNRIAALNAADNNATDWNPNADNHVNALAISTNGATVYAGGRFQNIGGQARNYIAALNTADNNATGWNPDADDWVYTLALAHDGARLYTGGAFNNIGGQARNRIAALNTADNNATDWNPNANDEPHALAISPDGATIYAAGWFWQIGGQARDYVAALNAADNNATDWNPNINEINVTAEALALAPDGASLYLGGDFNTIGGVPRRGFAIFALQHTLTYTAGANGGISGTATQTISHGCNGTAVSAIPATGYHFVAWSDNSTANPRQDTGVTSSIAVTATFALSLTAPDAPTNLAASAGDELGAIRLQWHPAARATGYEIWRDTSASGASATLQGAGTGTNYTDAGVTANVNYYYWVRGTNAAGAGAASAPAHGFAGVLGPMIMANGMVGDQLQLRTGDQLTLAARLNRGNLPAVNVDWWVVAYLHNGGVWYYMNNAMQWTPFDWTLMNCRPVYGGALLDLPITPAGPTLYPGAGVYNVWFGVDYPADGVLDISNPAYYRAARITITVE